MVSWTRWSDDEPLAIPACGPGDRAARIWILEPCLLLIVIVRRTRSRQVWLPNETGFSTHRPSDSRAIAEEPVSPKKAGIRGWPGAALQIEPRRNRGTPHDK